MHLVASARCMVLFSAKGVQVSWCHPGSLVHSAPCSLVPAPCSGKGSQGHPHTFDLLHESCSVHTCCRYLFDFDSQGLITVRSLNCFQPLDISWPLLFKLFGHVFGILSNLFEILLVNYGELSSGGSVDSGSSPPGVHQIGGPNCCDMGHVGAVGDIADMPIGRNAITFGDVKDKTLTSK